MVFSCKSYFQFLTHLLNRLTFLLDKPLRKFKALSKVKALFGLQYLIQLYCQLHVLGLYARWLFPLACLMCGASSESVPHLFLQCSAAVSLWNSLFGLFGECWVCHRSLDQFLMTSFTSFGRSKGTKFLWQMCKLCYTWCIWLEKYL